MRIGTWNVEYADTAATNERRRAALDANPADIWVLTETHDDLAPSGTFNSVHALQRPFYGSRVKRGSRWVSIWSRYPVERVRLEGADDERTVAAMIETPQGRLLVYGTVLPWNGDQGRMGENAEARGWSEHLRIIKSPSGARFESLIRMRNSALLAT